MHCHIPLCHQKNYVQVQQAHGDANRAISRLPINGLLLGTGRRPIFGDAWKSDCPHSTRHQTACRDRARCPALSPARSLVCPSPVQAPHTRNAPKPPHLAPLLLHEAHSRLCLVLLRLSRLSVDQWREQWVRGLGSPGRGKGFLSYTSNRQGVRADFSSHLLESKKIL